MIHLFIWLSILCEKYTYATTVLTKQEMEELYLPLDTTQLLNPSPSPRPIIEEADIEQARLYSKYVFGDPTGMMD
jgi:hypothetical protein